MEELLKTSAGLLVLGLNIIDMRLESGESGPILGIDPIELTFSRLAGDDIFSLGSGGGGSHVGSNAELSSLGIGGGGSVGASKCALSVEGMYIDL